MRIIVVLSLLVCLASYMVLEDPARPRRWATEAEEYFNRYALEREIEFSGLNLLDRADLEKLLPHTQSSIWWYFNRAELARALKVNPLVLEAKVGLCKGFYPPCFSFEIDERRPAFVVQSAQESWIVGQDGGFLSPIPKSDLNVMGSIQGDQPVIISGLFPRRDSADEVRNRFQQIKRAIEIIESGSGLKVRAVEIKPNAEIVVSFREVGFQAIFDLADDHATRLPLASAKLKRLLKEFSADSLNVARVDLAYNKLAVIRLNPKSH